MKPNVIRVEYGDGTVKTPTPKYAQAKQEAPKPEVKKLSLDEPREFEPLPEWREEDDQ